MAVLALCRPAPAQAPLRPAGVAYDAAGNLYYADTARHQVYESTLAGGLKVVVGTGEQGSLGDGGLATAALLNAPQAVAITPAGTLYVADTGNNSVRAVDGATGVITTVVSGLHGPAALALDSGGALLIADTKAHRIVRWSGGVLATVAGSGTQGFSGDGGLAVAASLDTPAGLAALPDGRIVIADTHNHRLRVIALDGTISTVAGTGAQGFSGDGGAATGAELASPRGLAVLPDGTVLVADSNNHRLRSISPGGVITTIVGMGTQGLVADASSAVDATLDTPRAVALSAYAQPTFADHVVRALIETNLYAVASESARTSSVTLTATGSSAVVQVQGSAGTPHGTVQVLESGVVLAQGSLANAAATVSLALVPGSHALTAAYSGDAFNPAATSVATTVTVGLVATTTSLSPPGSSYVGLPLTLTASVAPVAASGRVTFSENGNVLASAQVVHGVASGAYLTPTAGAHSIVASYSGDGVYAASTSAVGIATVAAMPGFTLAVVGPAAQTALNGATITYALSLAANPAPFSGAISLSAGGLPATTTVTFAPPQVVPGAGAVLTTMSVPTDKLLATTAVESSLFYALLLPLALVTGRRRWRQTVLFAVLLTATGCGTRVAPGTNSAAGSRAYTITVTATGTDLAGGLITRSTQVALTVQ